MIHRALHVLVTRPAVDGLLPSRPVPGRASQLDLPAASRAALNDLNRSARVIMPPIEHRKMRVKVQQLALANLRFRSYLLQRPALCAKIAASSTWCRRIGQLGIGGFGDFEAPELSRQRVSEMLFCELNLGTAAERLAHAEALDTSLTPLVELASKEIPQFRAEWIIRDPAAWQELIRQLEASDDAPVEAADSLAGTEQQIGRSLYLHADAFYRVDKASESSKFSDDLVEEAHAWAARLYGGTRDRAYNVAVMLDALGGNLAADPQRLISSMGLACFSRLALAHNRGQLLWRPRGLGDLFVLALGLLERLDNGFGFLHTWLILQAQALLQPDGPLAAHLPEVLIRIIDRRRAEPSLGDALLALPEALRALPVNDLLAALLDRADALESPYHRARAYIAFYRCWPHRRPDILIQAERLADAIPEVLDHGIVLASLASVHPDAHSRARLRRAAIDAVADVDPEGLFAMSFSQMDLVRFSDRWLPPPAATEPAPALVGLRDLRVAWLAYLSQYSMETGDRSRRVWQSLKDRPAESWRLALRHLRTEWLELTPPDLPALRQLPRELRGKLHPYIRTLDEGLLGEFVADMPELAPQMSLIAIENGRWSPQAMRDVVAYLRSDDDVLRLRARQALAGRTLACSQIGEATVLEAARLLGQNIGDKTLLWFVTDLLHDSPDAILTWCRQLDDRHDDALRLVLERCLELTEPVWRAMLAALAAGGPRSQAALLLSIRDAFENQIPSFCRGPALEDVLRGILAQEPCEVVAMRIADLLGFVREGGEELLRAFPDGGSAAVHASAMMAAGRRRLEPFDLAVQLAEARVDGQRVVVYVAHTLRGGEPPEQVQDDTQRQLYTRARIAACFSLWISNASRRAIADAAAFIVERWDAGDDVPIHELLALLDALLVSADLESYSTADPLTAPARFAPLRFRDALRVAAAAAELIPAAFAELAAPRAERWLGHLSRCAERATSYVDRAAALRLIGAMPTASSEAVQALVAGLNDDPFVAEAARDLCEHFPRPSERAIRALLKLLGSGRPTLTVAAARVLASACAFLDGDKRRAVHDPLIATLQQLLRSETARHPVVTLEATAGHAYALKRGNDLGSELAEILFQLQGSRISEGDGRIRPRHAIAQVRFTVQPSSAHTASARVAIGELATGDNSMLSQRDVLRIDSPSFDVITEAIALCQRLGYSIVDLHRLLAEDRSIPEEGTP